MPRARTSTLLALTTSLVAGCAYISDEDEKWRLDPDGDGSLLGDDCDDSDGDLAQTVTWYTDADGDGFGAPGSEQTGCEAPAGSADNGDDCDDADNTVFPDAPDEWYDGVDSNCLGDDDYDQDGDGYANDVDCDDEDPTRAPDASVSEIYFNGVDDNCDNTDEDGDQDGDGFWASDYVARVNAAGATPLPIPDGAAGDCWDDDSSVPVEQEVVDGFPALTAADVNPGATETFYDSADQDCGGFDTNGDGIPDDFDQDGDSHASLNHPNRAGEVGDDCDDTASDVNPSATETWYDGVDADCGGEDDYDADGDLYQSDAHGGTDCDDQQPGVNPGALDFWYDGVDQDCGGEDDYDADGDGEKSDLWGGYDCDDLDDSINPDADEIWYDGVDQDCDRGSDYDADGDGYDSSTELAGGGDCDDANRAANPGMTEICDNGFDDDCDGSGESTAGLCWLEGEFALTDADTRLNGVSATQSIGKRVAVGGDVDGDGAADWAFGLPGDDAAASNAGAVYLDSVATSGALDVDTLGVTITGAASGDAFGASLVMGDFDGDGNDDVFVGAHGRDDLASLGGGAYLFLGPVTAGRYAAATSSDALVSGPTADAGFGQQSVLLGDQDGDGADEFVAMSTASDGWELTIVSGVTTGTSSSAAIYASLSGVDDGDSFGYAMDGTGDVDGDGVADLVVGAIGVDSSGTSNAGAVYVFHGPVTTSGTAADGVELIGSGGGDRVGTSVSIGGDVDADGYDDLLVGATGAATGGSTHDGGAYLVHGPATVGGTISSLAGAAIGAPTSASFCGSSVSLSGDVDGDGAADVLVGCEWQSLATSYGGAVHLIYEAPTGAVDLASDSFAQFAGTSSFEMLGIGMGVPDVDGDGYDEVLIGSPNFSRSASYQGRVGLFLGDSW
jgi:hypothetical protein